MKARNTRVRQKIGHLIGISVGFAWVLILMMPGQAKLHVRGPMNTGHEDLQCPSCHKPAPGTPRQQLQANVRYLLGSRGSLASFGHLDVTNATCLDCHDRPNDRHPVFRFFEPRFKEVREKIAPQFCISCHLEHSGMRVTIVLTTYCAYCHEDTKVKHDPITVSHADLIAGDYWESCLGCHDFHGNHVMETNTDVEETLAINTIRAYFAGGPSPYSNAKHYQAKREGDHE